MLRYTTQKYTTLQYTTLQYTTSHYTTSHYTTLQYTTLHYTKLNYTTLHYTTLHYTTLHYTTLHYTELNYTALYDTTLHYTTIHFTGVIGIIALGEIFFLWMLKVSLSKFLYSELWKWLAFKELLYLDFTFSNDHNFFVFDLGCVIFSMQAYIYMKFDSWVGEIFFRSSERISIYLNDLDHFDHFCKTGHSDNLEFFEDFDHSRFLVTLICMTSLIVMITLITVITLISFINIDDWYSGSEDL